MMFDAAGYDVVFNHASQHAVEKLVGFDSPGTDQMQRISGLIRDGAMAFLRTEYTVLAGFVVVMFFVLWVFLPGNSLLTALSFLVGASLSASAFALASACICLIRSSFELEINWFLVGSRCSFWFPIILME